MHSLVVLPRWFSRHCWPRLQSSQGLMGLGHPIPKNLTQWLWTESLGSLLTVGWQDTQFLPCLLLHSRAPSGSSRHTSWLYQEQGNQEREQAGNCHVFHDLVSEVTNHWVMCVLLITSEWLSPTDTRLSSEGGKLSSLSWRRGISKNLWPYFKTNKVSYQSFFFFFFFANLIGGNGIYCGVNVHLLIMRETVFFNSFTEVWLIYKGLHICNVYNLRSLDRCRYSKSRHHHM